MFISGRNIFIDFNGKELFHLRNKLIAINKSFIGEAPDGTDLFTVKGKFSLLSSKSEINFTNKSDGAAITLHLKGDWMDRSAEVTTTLSIRHMSGPPTLEFCRGLYRKQI
ncbi:MAG: hypothetical protein HETSPECPRED_004580 [Heterodermia speciosa]|uniref:Uncharacterized protein n=1 Tax=Heterodermia speciosa TaxID=116794 RepID=A0A8H3IJW9_9LECA|nr:MAG: hypothetical protein HETSPECPRED_004580 [Heterodermia speciosa]